MSSNYIIHSLTKQGFLVIIEMGNCQRVCDVYTESKVINQNSSQSQGPDFPYPQKEYATYCNQSLYEVSGLSQEIVRQMGDLQKEQLSKRGVSIDGYYHIIPLEVCYRGQWQSGRPHGEGQVIFKNGTYIKGWFTNGICYGSDCLFIDPQGSYYRGEIKKNRLEGQGKYISNKYSYEGQWVDNCPQGKGIQTFNGPQASVYEGYFVKGVKQGKDSLYTWKNHQIYHHYEGSFSNNWFSGPGKLYKTNKQIIEGNFQGDIPKNATITSQKYIYTGELRNGVISGDGKLKVLNSGDELKGTFINGQIHGRGTILYNDKTQPEQKFFFKGKVLQDWKDIPEQLVQQIIRIIEKSIQRNSYLEQVVADVEKTLQSNSDGYKVESGPKAQKETVRNTYREYVIVAIGKNFITVGNPKSSDIEKKSYV